MVVSWDFWNLLAMKGFLWEDQTTEGENALAGETTGVKDNSMTINNVAAPQY